MEKFKLFILLCFSMLIFFVGSVQAIDKEVIEHIRRSVVLLSVNKLKEPQLNTPNSLCSGVSIYEKGNILKTYSVIPKDRYKEIDDKFEKRINLH